MSNVTRKQLNLVKFKCVFETSHLCFKFYMWCCSFIFDPTDACRTPKKHLPGRNKDNFLSKLNMKVKTI